MSSFPIGTRVVRLAVVQLLFLSTLFSQVSDLISTVNVGQPRTGEPLKIRIELINATVIERVDIAYRSFGQSSFKQSEMSVTGNSASVLIPANELNPPFLEYFFILQKRSNAMPETYPVENPTEHPFKVDLQAAAEFHESVIVLSPDQDERVVPEDLYISFSLLRADSTVDKSHIRTSLDGADISGSAVVSGNLVVNRPSLPLTPGQHSIRVELFDNQGKSVQTVSWEFTIAVPRENAEPAPQSAWVYNYNLQGETRNENIRDVATPYNRLTLSATAHYDQYRVYGNLYVTNEEKEKRQPQNRYFIGAEASWLKIGYGDNYPSFPNLVMTGKRVRGLTASITTGKFNLDVIKGDINRHIESDTLKTFSVDSLAAEQQRDSSAAYGLYDPATNRWAKFNYGTFSRDILIIRPTLGTRQGTHVGFTYLKSNDDQNSVRIGVRPKENLLIGSDLLLLFDQRNIEISGQVAMSATNEDATGGTMTDAEVDSLYKDESASRRDHIKQIRELLKRFITVNAHLIPLSMNNLPTLAYEGGVALNYYGNNLRFTYLRHGNNFESFGQSFIRTDVRGYNIADRHRLVNGQLILSGGFERLQDNTADTKPATTTFMTGNFSIGYFPRTEIPDITLAYLLASSSNNNGSDSLFGVDDKTNRVFVQLGKEFDLGARHNATLGVNTSTRDDNTPKNLGTKNTGVSLGDALTFAIPIEAQINLTTVTNTFKMRSAGGTLKDTSINYTTLYLGGHLRLMEDQLRLSGAVSPTFGDIQRAFIDVRAQYYFVENISLASQVSLYLNTSTNNDIIWSLILRADM